MRCSFVDRVDSGPARLRGWRQFLQSCGRRLELGAGEVSVLLCGDAEMTRLNRRWRRKAGPTDVLSFPDHGVDPQGRVHLGDIAISVETASRQAEAAGWNLDREVRLLLVHGLLHVLGYDHEKDDGEMKALEEDLVQALIGGRSL